MKKINIFIATGVVIVILIILFSVGNKKTALAPENEQDITAGETKTGTTGAKTTQTTNSGVKTSAVSTASNLPEIDFLDKRLTFTLKDYPDVKFNINRVVFGRGETVTSTGCSGIPNADFSAYLYPGSGICIGAETVDGSPRGIVAFHMLVENNGNLGVGGNSNLLQLEYLRTVSIGKPEFRFAHPLSGLDKYYINGYSSKEIILSYLVPEDQLIFNLVSGYKEPALENKTLNVYDFSINGLLVDFGTKSLKIVK